MQVWRARTLMDWLSDASHHYESRGVHGPRTRPLSLGPRTPPQITLLFMPSGDTPSRSVLFPIFFPVQLVFEAGFISRGRNKNTVSGIWCLITSSFVNCVMQMFVHKEFDLMLFYKQLLMAFWDYGRINIKRIYGIEPWENSWIFQLLTNQNVQNGR